MEIAAGQAAEAQADIKKVPALQPNDVQANNDAAWLLSTSPLNGVRDGKAAIAFATKACALTSWKDARLLDTLAAAYAENGNFAEALKWQQYALKMAGPEDQADLQAMRERLALYQKHTPYREAKVTWCAAIQRAISGTTYCTVCNADPIRNSTAP